MANSDMPASGTKPGQDGPSKPAESDFKKPEADLAKRSALNARIYALINSLSVAAGLIILFIAFSFASPHFFTFSNIYRLLQQTAVVATLAVGQSFVIFTSGIDLSQAAVLALSAVIGSSVMVDTGSIILGILATLVISIAAGIVNALLITKVKLVPFIATLAMLGIGSGSALLYTSGQPVFNLPPLFAVFGSSGFLIFPFIVVVAACLAIVMQFVASETRLGRYIYAIGSNERSALIAGIRTQRVLLWVYGISGLSVGIAAILLTAYVNTAQPIQNMNFELDSIAAVIIGGGSLFGGEGTIWGSMIGALLIGVLDNGTELVGLSTYVQTILLGVVVVIAVGLDNFRRAKRVAA